MCTWETSKIGLLKVLLNDQGNLFQKVQFYASGKKTLQNRYQNTFFRDKIKPFKKAIIVEIMYTEPKLEMMSVETLTDRI